MQQWKTLDRQVVLSRPPFLTIEQHTVELPDGKVIEDWPWVVTPDYVNVVAVTEEGAFICFRQTKYAIEGTSLATVGGYIDQDEPPLTAAQRELREETGYEAPEWIALGSYPVDGNRGAGTAHIFLAKQAQRVAEIDADDLEEQELLLLSAAEVEQALADGSFKLLSWSAAIALALLQLKGRP